MTRLAKTSYSSMSMSLLCCDKQHHHQGCLHQSDRRCNHYRHHHHDLGQGPPSEVARSGLVALTLLLLPLGLALPGAPDVDDGVP